MLIDGLKIASEIEKEIQEKVKAFLSRKPALAVLLIGNHAPSQIYVHRKALACQRAGIELIKHHLSENAKEPEVLAIINHLNRDPVIDGILVQLPLPAHINPASIIHRLDPEKDVDGLHPMNAGKLLIGETDGFVPCTPLGIKTLLERACINTSGKHVVILGRSNLVGKPLAALLMQKQEGANATVTILHSRSTDTEKLCREADILVAAMGIPRFVTQEMIKDGCAVIDVGINKVEAFGSVKGYEIVGDVDFDSVKKRCSFITPVPGGVGPMTIAMLLNNTLKSYLKKHPC